MMETSPSFFLFLLILKKLNDTQGHQAGDLTLKRVAEIMIVEKGTEDIACRYGGEELVLILPETKKVSALVIAELIRQKVEEAELEFEGNSFGVTLSGGVAAYPLDAQNIKALIHAADIALYQAKENSRNRICLHDLDKRHYIRIDFRKKCRSSKSTRNPNNSMSREKISVTPVCFSKALLPLKSAHKYRYKLQTRASASPLL